MEQQLKFSRMYRLKLIHDCIIRHMTDAEQYQRLAEKQRSLFEKLCTHSEGAETPQDRKIYTDRKTLYLSVII